MKKILIVEDDPFLQSAYKTILTKEGYQVAVSIDGQFALNQATEDEPDLILLDLLMPRLDGIEFLRKYDVIHKHPNVKIIVFSNNNTPEKMQEATELGAAKYVVKTDFSPKEMVALIKTVLG